MGKLVLIGLVLIVVILSTILVSVRNRSDVSVDNMALRSTRQEAELLANYAMQYGVKLLNDRTQVPNKAELEDTELEDNISYKKSFSTAFNVKDGVIDSLIYAYDASDNVVLDAYVTYNANDNSVNSVTRAVLEVPPPDTVRANGVDNALTCNGPIKVQTGVSSKKGIHGNVQSDSTITYQGAGAVDGTATENVPFPDFSSIFGMTIDEMRDIADYVGTDPGDPCDGINFLSGEESYIVNNADFAVGSGILVVEGDLTLNGDLNFTGIIWITGILGGLGNSHVIGAIFASGAELSEAQGSFLLEYDSSVNTTAFTNREGKGPFKVLAVYKDYRN